MLYTAVVEDDAAEAGRIAEYLDRYAAEKGLEIRHDVYENAFLFMEGYHHQYDLVFMDIQMPQINGMEAAVWLRTVDRSAAPGHLIPAPGSARPAGAAGQDPSAAPGNNACAPATSIPTPASTTSTKDLPIIYKEIYKKRLPFGEASFSMKSAWAHAAGCRKRCESGRKGHELVRETL